MLGLVFNTVRYLKPLQVYSRVLRRRPRRVAFGPRPQLRPQAGSWEIGVQRDNSQIGPNEFRFLNQERQIRSWNDSGCSKLWLYNLHYFDNSTPNLIRKWIDENPVGNGNGWESHTLSRRICNWIKWSFAGNPLEETALFEPRSPSALSLKEGRIPSARKSPICKCESTYLRGSFFPRNNCRCLARLRPADTGRSTIRTSARRRRSFRAKPHVSQPHP